MADYAQLSETHGNGESSAHAALSEALAKVGDRWTLLIIAALLERPKRFGDLQQELDGIAPNILTQRLRQLERDALLVARRYSERPPRFVYELATSGQELADVVRLLESWGARSSGGDLARRHSICGTALEARWWCPSCEEPVGQEDGEDLHFA